MPAKTREQARLSRKQFYATHPDYVKQQVAERKRQLRLMVQEAKAVPCADCGVQYPYCAMQFDHVRGTKDFDVSRGPARGFSIKRIQAEIEKCDVVCANCHAIRTHERAYGSVAQLA